MLRHFFPAAESRISFSETLFEHDGNYREIAVDQWHGRSVPPWRMIVPYIRFSPRGMKMKLL